MRYAIRYRFALWCAVAWLLLGPSYSLWATTWSVTSTADSGPGSLRDAINSANAVQAPPRDTIVFAIPGGGPHTIALDSALAPITDVGVVIDGYTQSGATPNSLAQGNNAVLKVELRYPSATSQIGFDLQGDSCTIRGLSICDFRYCVRVYATTEESIVEGNWLGVLSSGAAAGAIQSGVRVDGLRNRIGGTLPSERNVVSANANGIQLLPGAKYNRVEGNYIGTNVAGTSALGNVFSGIFCSTADSNVIGGSSPGQGNLVSGNGSHEMYFVSDCEGNVVAGNVVGLDASGTSDIAVANYGISVYNSPGNTIEGNTITGAAVYNVFLDGDPSKFNRIQGNYIGSDSSGLVALSNSSAGIGLLGADSNIIGGMTVSERNTFVGLNGGAIQILSSAEANLVVGNRIGLNAAGVGLGNGFMQIFISDSRANQIGTTDWASGNVIAYSDSSAVCITGTSTHNSVLSNSVYSNGALAIDLGPDGITANDSADLDLGPNDRQNYPVLSSAYATGGGTLVNGLLNSVPNEAFLIQVFANPGCHTSGHGEGVDICDTFTVGTDALGKAPFSHNMVVDQPVGSWLSATATSDLGETSEFSACEEVAPADVNDTLRFYLFSPVDMVVTDPVGDSIGIDAATDTMFNTIQNSSTYDTTTNAGGSSELDDVITIPHPMAGNYRIRIFREDGASDSATFTQGIRINGNQLLIPEGYQDAALSALGTTLPDTVIWTAAVTLPGDVNGDGDFTSSDLIYFVNYIFKSGPGPVVTDHGDVNCNDVTNSADIIYMVNFIFKGGPPPCSQSGG